MTRPALVRACAAAVLVAVVTPACGIGDRERYAKGIHAARLKATEAPASGTLTFELTLDEDTVAELEGEQRDRLEAALAGAPDAGTPALTAHADIDLVTRRARLTFDDAGTEPAALFADSHVFVRRRNARPTERRTWAKLDLLEVVDDERPLDMREMVPGDVLTTFASTLSPVYLVELVEGTLSGSVKVAGRESIGDVPVTRYDVNISFDKAMTELDFDDEERAVRLGVFALLGSRRDVVPGVIWLDGDGRLRRLRIELEQRVTRRRVNDLAVTVDLAPAAAQVAIDPPSDDVTVTYERFGRLVRSALPEGT